MYGARIGELAEITGLEELNTYTLLLLLVLQEMKNKRGDQDEN